MNIVHEIHTYMLMYICTANFMYYAHSHACSNKYVPQSSSNVRIANR